MPASARRLDLRAAVLLALVAGLCAYFWTQSRYPSLQGKASADPDEALATPLGFEKHFPEPGLHEPLKHTLWSAAEWAITNKQGMTFGLLFAAGMLTLVPLLPPVRGGRFLGALQGAVVGAPLGVCINCAAPIGQAMLRGGARVETALATMFASPSFNVIVLGILLSLFPFYLVALKLAASALMVLVVVPWLAHVTERRGWRKPVTEAAPRLPGLGLFQWLERGLTRAETRLLRPDDAQPLGPLAAIGWVLLRLPRNLVTVLLIALPLMLLAGLIGAAMAELLPWGRLAQIAQVEGFAPNALVLLGVTAFGVLLPVPIAFDVIVCAVLWDAGVPPQLVAALLVTLGIYSVYPWSLIGTTLSWRLAAAAGAAVFALGVAAGGAAAVLDHWHELRLARRVAQLLDTLPASPPQAAASVAGRSAAELQGLALKAPVSEKLAAGEGVELWRAAPVPAIAGGTGRFVRVDGAQLGFERLPLPRAYRIMEPATMHLGALASADVNGDGWPDVASGTSMGVQLYLNLGGRFARQRVDDPALAGALVTALAFADLDVDGAPDLVACTWMGGCRVLFGRGGAFDASHSVELPRGAETSVQSLAFADVDRDGDLDLVTGAATYVPRFFYPATSVNRLWRNDGHGHFAPEPLAGPEGETLTLLFLDYDGDGWPDLYVGNDFDEPDRLYRNDHGRLLPVAPDAAPIPRTTHDTMSADAGDLDNDGREELYLGAIAMGAPGAGFASRVATPLPSCEAYAEVADRARCDEIARFQLAAFRGYSVQSMAPCEQLQDPAAQRECVVSAYYWNRILARLPVLGADRDRVLRECERIPADFGVMHDICAAIPATPMDHERSDSALPGQLPQVRQTNLLYRATGKGFEDVTSAWKAGLGGWTWSARFADFDNDGWQDLFITQGTRLRPNSPSAVMYRNDHGHAFADRAHALGLEDHNPTGAALYLDLDLDGDLDLVTAPFLMAPVVWRNDAATSGAIDIALEDHRSANVRAIGARIELLGPGGARQMRTLRASGGYQTSDDPIAHFGLGDWASASAIEVTWPDGQVQKLEGKFGAGRYRVVRLH